MRTKEFLSKLEHEEIVQAIREAESKTAGKIHVFFQRGKLNGDPLVAAQKRFHRLGLHKNAQRNDVLIFVAPRAHKFAIVGDKAIHQTCGDELWQNLVARMREHFRNEKFTHALTEAIDEIGRALATHFPRGSTASGRSPDQVIEG
ncbi:MAG TPA: TPM domain-containing protein [Chthoniobacterales bacterium]|nr:TPM domain-containing protein [Chthoniobacterales bacterium]